MSKIPFEVVDRHADQIAGEPVRDGIVNLSDAQAEHFLRMGAIRGLESTFTPDVKMTLPARHPLDHDGDGRPGGSLPGRKRGRPRRDSPTNPPERPDGSPPMPYLPREGA
jgi:hypothetical protein